MFKDLVYFWKLKIQNKSASVQGLSIFLKVWGFKIKVQVFKDLVYFWKTFTKTSKCLTNWTEKDSKDRATVFERKEVEGE